MTHVVDAEGRIKEAWGVVPLFPGVVYTRGDLIRGGAANWESYPVGAVNEVLTNDGTDVFWSAGAIDLTAGKTLTVGASLTLAGTDAKTLTIEDNSWINQDLTTDSSPTLANLTIGAGGGITMPDAGWIGNSAATARLGFDSSGAIDFVYVLGGPLVVGDTSTVADRLSVQNQTINTTTGYWGARFDFYKTAGATDADDVFQGFFVRQDLDQVGGTVGYTTVFPMTFVHDAGEIGDVANARYLRLGGMTADLNAGKIWGLVDGTFVFIDQEAGHEITGNVYGHRVKIDLDGTVGGTSYMLYLDERTGIDYGIYQSGGALNHLDGALTVGGTVAATAQLLVDQSSLTGGIPVMKLDQADLSEEFINFKTTVGGGNPVDAGATGAYYGKLRVAINGVFKVLALYEP